MLAVCTVKDTKGRPIPGVAVDVWETDSKGFYDVQYADRGDKPDGRAIVESDNDGVIFFKAIVPVPYPIPSDGPVGKLLLKLKRHCYRPSHMHFMFKKDGFDKLITYVYTVLTSSHVKLTESSETVLFTFVAIPSRPRMQSSVSKNHSLST
jgi:protocatechuate 3,4-dioxygenase beta subunit